MIGVQTPLGRASQALQGLPGHLLRRGSVSGLLQESGLGLVDIGIHGGVQRIEMLVKPQGVKYLAALGNGLTH